jgi:type III secretion protein C
MAEGVLQPPSSLGALSYTTSGPAIVASSQQNAIIVRDYPNRIYLYKNLIAALDTPSQIVEIEATIMDVNTDKLRNLGIEWRYSGNESNGEVMFTKDATKKNFIDTLAGNSVSVLDQIPGFQIGAIIGDKNQFIARINALEEEGVVSVSSRPKVATLNDLEAVIESSTSFYVPVNGAYDVDLFQVLTGTVLRVTPHLITHDWGTQIRLIVAIEDGSVAGVNNGIPVTKRHAVTTQALVNTGHSLLLGGLVREEEEASDYKVPYLGDIPWLGNFFKSQFKSKGQSERLFLISPRIVAPDGSDQAEAKKQPLSRLPKDPDCKGKCQLELSDEQPLVF